ncbi:MAG: hypothetical protein RMJ28_06300 [Nitrososphaerota archaeon]|nr:hypothetical protein [Candidatus Calditenuaceae archaeon]MDW8073825.1 hypothetical protein [Nitrososphaerota archaeon]
MLGKVAEIVSDRRSGSSQIAMNLLNYLVTAFSTEGEPPEADQFLEELYATVLRRRSLISPINLIEVLRRAHMLQRNEAGAETPLKEAVLRLRELYGGALEVALRAGEERLTLYDTLLTLSKSSQVLSLVKRLPSVEVRVLTGWPLMDGLAAYAELRASGVKAFLFPDLSVFEAAEGVDALLIGCDAILLDGSAVNRSGSKTAALVAEELGIPTIVICDSTKLDLNSLWAPEKWSLASDEASVEFQVFEKVDSRLVTEYVSELGCLKPDKFVASAGSELVSSWPRRVARLL